MTTSRVKTVLSMSVGDATQQGLVWRKDFIREGVFRARGEKAGSKKAFVVPRERIDKWQRNFKLMRERGVTVPITVDHIDVTDPKTGLKTAKKLTPGMAEAKRGEVVNLFRDGARGMFDGVPSDEEAATLMSRCPEVSLECEENAVIDGHTYDDVITAITLTPIPVVTGQKGWEIVKASRESEREVYYLSAESITSIEDPSQENRMTLEQLLASLRTSMGLPVDATAEAVSTAVAGLVSSKTELSRAKSEVDVLSGEVTKLSRELMEAKSKQTVQTVGLDAVEVDEDAMDMAITAAKTRINNHANLTPNQKKVLLSRIETTGNSQKVCLSRKAAKVAGLDKPMLDLILEVFDAGNAAEMQALLKEQTKAQTKTELSRSSELGAAGGVDATYDPEVTKQMIQNANGNGGKLVL